MSLNERARGALTTRRRVFELWRLLLFSVVVWAFGGPALGLLGFAILMVAVEPRAIWWGLVLYSLLPVAVLFAAPASLLAATIAWAVAVVAPRRSVYSLRLQLLAGALTGLLLGGSATLILALVMKEREFLVAALGGGVGGVGCGAAVAWARTLPFFDGSRLLRP